MKRLEIILRATLMAALVLFAADGGAALCESSPVPLVIGHRGASGYAPENTMKAFVKAHEMGSDMIELDVHLTADGELAVIHDPDTKRTTGSENLVAAMKFEDIRKLDAGSWMAPEFAGERIPSLLEVLEWANGNIRVNIEIKSAGCEEKVVQAIEKLKMENSIIVSSFHHEYLKKIKELNKNIVTAALTGDLDGKKDLKTIIDECSPDAVNPRYLTLTKKTVDLAHKAGLKVYVYTVNDPMSMKRMIAAGVDGVITNYPDVLKEVIKSGGAK